MYIVINKTKRSTTKILGHFPDLDSMLNRGDIIIVISLYSMTIKVPQCTVLNGINEWEWIDYTLPLDLLANYYNLHKDCIDTN